MTLRAQRNVLACCSVCRTEVTVNADGRLHAHGAGDCWRAERDRCPVHRVTLSRVFGCTLCERADAFDVPPAAPELAPLELQRSPELAPLELQRGSEQASTWPQPRGAIVDAGDGLRMLDLFAGSGAASRAAAVRGWTVVRVDVADGTSADVRADISTWPAAMPAWLREHRFDLIWASPPCDSFSSANPARNVDDGMACVRAAVATIQALRPRWWVIENVHGATRAIGSLLGPPVERIGSFYLWGIYPPFRADVPRNKTKLSGRRRAERRAAIPWQLSDGLIRACETLAAELRRAR